MSPSRSTFVLVFVLFAHVALPGASGGQQATAATQSAIQRDPQAITLAQQTLAAMGGAQALLLQDSVAVGQAQIFRPDGTSTTFPITKKSKSTTMVRTELQRPEGTRIRVVNGGVGGILYPDGTTRAQSSNNTVAERVEHIPALSILTEWSSSTMEVRYVGADTVNGSPVQVIALSYIPTSDPTRANLYRSVTQTLFYIDQATSLVSKTQYQNFADTDSNVSEKVEVFYSNYRAVSGVLVPFAQTYYADGRLRSTLAFTSVAFNTGLASSEFTVPGGN